MPVSKEDAVAYVRPFYIEWPDYSRELNDIVIVFSFELTPEDIAMFDALISRPSVVAIIDLGDNKLQLVLEDPHDWQDVKKDIELTFLQADDTTFTLVLPPELRQDKSTSPWTNQGEKTDDERTQMFDDMFNPSEDEAPTS